jgi:hypothetical protein
MTLLLGGLLLAEFPELLQLRDDTSNDFTVLVATQTASPAPSLAKFTPRPGLMVAPHVGAQRIISAFPVFSSPDFAIQSAVQYLHLLCVHRT